MARPKIEVSEKRNYHIMVNLNEAEKNFFKKHNIYSGEKLRDFIIDNMNKKNIIITSEKDPKYINELNKIGVNLNQIAKKYNSLNELSDLDIDKISKFIDVLEQKIKE